ncbi:hypothetical protein PNU79_07155 [Turicibacter sanguinis]|nr:hypothetical protein [Turicibacter sanguinis]MDB8541768.1 hypothetical protein [Turicibacter sanguinis]
MEQQNSFDGLIGMRNALTKLCFVLLMFTVVVLLSKSKKSA